MKDQLKNKQGFTIIEVVLVLAIAALIMLMVFIALPALQRSQRDTQRKDDISRLQASVSSYTANNRGKAPFGDSSTQQDLLNNYLKVDEDELFQDPQGEDYRFVPKLSAVAYEPAGSGEIAVHGGGKCSEGESAGGDTITSARSGALRIRLESGGVHCIEY